MAHPHNSESAVRIVSHYFTMKGAKRDMDIILMDFLKQRYSRQIDHFGLKMVGPRNFGSAQTFA